MYTNFRKDTDGFLCVAVECYALVDNRTQKD